MKNKFSIAKVIMYILVSFLLAIIYGIIVNNTNILPSFFYLDSNKINIENLMYYMWEVQVTIALISISLVSLIVGKLDYKIYGIDIKSILMMKQWFILNYIEKIVYIIALSVLNMWFIFYSFLPGLVAIFIFSIIGIVMLLVDSFLVLFNDDKCKNIIINELVKIIHKSKNESDLKVIYEYLAGINGHNRNLVMNNNLEIIIDNENYLLQLIGIINEEKLPDERKRICSSIEEKIEYLIDVLCSNKLASFSVVLIDNIVNNKIDFENKEYLIFELLEILVGAINENMSEKEINDISNYCLDDFLYKIDCDKVDLNSVVFIAYRCIYMIYNLKNNEYKRHEIFEKQIKRIIPTEFSTLNEKQFLVKQRTINNLIKLLIRNLNKDYFEYFFREFYRINSLSFSANDTNRANETIIIVNIYIYYIVCKEKLYSDEFKKSVYSFMDIKGDKDNVNSESFGVLIRRIESSMWNYYPELKEEMVRSGFEYLPSGQVKELILENSIDLYFLFYTITFVEVYDYNNIINSYFDIKLSSDILRYFTDEGKFKNDIDDEFNKFLEFYKIKKSEEIQDKINQFYFLINRKFSRLILLQQKKYFNDEKVRENKNKIIEEIFDRLNKNSLYTVEDDNKEGKEYYLQPLPIDVGILSGDIGLLGESYSDIVVNSIEEVILNNIKEKSIIYTYRYNDVCKIKKIIELIDDNDMNINAEINGELINEWWIVSNESDEDKTLLGNMESRIKSKYKLGRKNSDCILFNDNAKRIILSIKRMDICDLENYEVDKLIETNYEIEKDYYKVEIFNGIKALFTIDELKTYLSFKYKCCKVSFVLATDFKEALYLEKKIK